MALNTVAVAMIILKLVNANNYWLHKKFKTFNLATKIRFSFQPKVFAFFLFLSNKTSITWFHTLFASQTQGRKLNENTNSSFIGVMVLHNLWQMLFLIAIFVLIISSVYLGNFIKTISKEQKIPFTKDFYFPCTFFKF